MVLFQNCIKVKLNQIIVPMLIKIYTWSAFLVFKLLKLHFWILSRQSFEGFYTHKESSSEKFLSKIYILARNRNTPPTAFSSVLKEAYPIPTAIRSSLSSIFSYLNLLSLLLTFFKILFTSLRSYSWCRTRETTKERRHHPVFE